jgi:glycosyltransferase involved in cell wall biosynthesis
VGNLLHWKGFSLGLQAFARFQMYHPRSEYWIVGTGPERGRLDQLARKLGVSRNVTFWGALPREQVLEKLQQTDALLHPSLHDSGGWVCLEAMATRHPVICLDLGGPALQVIPGSGIKLPAKSPEQVVSDLTAALLRLAQDSRIREQMGEASRLRVQNHFDWTRKGEQMQQIYQTTAPAGGMPC